MDRKSVNRFVSTLAGAFRSFYIYKSDNNAFDEIMQNVVRRFQDTQSSPAPLPLAITNCAMVFEGEPVGSKELTVTLAGVLQSLGYKKIQFQAPLAGRNFMQLLHILALKEPSETKNEKLMPLIDEGEPKPIMLVPITANSFLLKFSDEMITRRLAPLTTPKEKGGPGYIEEIHSMTVENIPDILSAAFGHLNLIKDPLQSFVSTLIQATQEGHFPTQRFIKLMPFSPEIKTHFAQLSGLVPAKTVRMQTELGHGYKVQKRTTGKQGARHAWINYFVSFSDEETAKRREWRTTDANASSIVDLSMAESLLRGSGSDRRFGLSLLLRSFADKNTADVQDRALQLAIEFWTESLNSADGSEALLSTLRDQLASVKYLGLVLGGLKSTSVDSSHFMDTARFISSLGNSAIPSLITLLDMEKDRGMRKKICLLLTSSAQKSGVEIIIEALEKANTYLKRNLVLVLGDVQSPQTAPVLISLTGHPEKIIRTEAVRSLAKNGSEVARHALNTLARQSTDPELKQMAADIVALAKPAPPKAGPAMSDARDTNRKTRDEDRERYWNSLRALYTAFKNIRLYTPEHPSAKEAAQKFVESLKESFRLHAGLALQQGDGLFIVGDTLLIEESLAFFDLLHALEDHKINKVAFLPGIEPNEIINMCVLLLKKNVALREFEGPHIKTAAEVEPEQQNKIKKEKQLLEKSTKVYDQMITTTKIVFDKLIDEQIIPMADLIEPLDQLMDGISRRPSDFSLLISTSAEPFSPYRHAVNTAILSLFMAQQLALDHRAIKTIGIAGLLHDIGRQLVPTEKSKELSSVDTDLIRLHARDGACFLVSAQGVPMAVVRIALEHHIGFDEKGYPQNTPAQTPHLFSQLVGLADFVSWGTVSERFYHRAIAPFKRIRTLMRRAGTQFSPLLVKILLPFFGLYPPGTQVRLDSGKEGIVIKVNLRDITRPVVLVPAADGNWIVDDMHKIKLIIGHRNNIVPLVEFLPDLES